MNYTKSEKRVLRELVAAAYERELTKALKELNKNFLKWEKGQINAFELHDHIHKFHDGISRELWNVYANGHHDFAVIQAIANEIILRKEVENTLWSKIEQRVNILKERRKRWPDPRF